MIYRIGNFLNIRSTMRFWHHAKTAQRIFSKTVNSRSLDGYRFAVPSRFHGNPASRLCTQTCDAYRRKLPASRSMTGGFVRDPSYRRP